MIHEALIALQIYFSNTHSVIKPGGYSGEKMSADLKAWDISLMWILVTFGE